MQNCLFDLKSVLFFLIHGLCHHTKIHISIKLNLHSTRGNTLKRVASWESLSPQLYTVATQKCCSGGELLAILSNLTGLGVEPESSSKPNIRAQGQNIRAQRSKYAICANSFVLGK